MYNNWDYEDNYDPYYDESYGDYDYPLIKQADPELERLLAEEEEIEKRVRESRKPAGALFVHDCGECRYISPIIVDGGVYDLYFHLRSPEKNSDIVIRYSDQGDDYGSLTLGDLRFIGKQMSQRYKDALRILIALDVVSANYLKALVMRPFFGSDSREDWMDCFSEMPHEALVRETLELSNVAGAVVTWTWPDESGCDYRLEDI